MKIKWSRIYKKYFNKAKGDTLKDTLLNAHVDMMHDYWNGAIPGVPRGRYGELPPGESYRWFRADLHSFLFAAHVVHDEPEDPRHICDLWSFCWSVIFCVSFAFEIVSLYTRNRIFVLVCLSVMLFSLAMCTFLRIKKVEVKKMRKTLMPETSREFLFEFDRFVDNITNPEAIGLIINPNKTLTDHALDLLLLSLGIFQALKQYVPEKLEFAFQGSKNALRAAELYHAKTLAQKEGK